MKGKIFFVSILVLVGIIGLAHSGLFDETYQFPTASKLTSETNSIFSNQLHEALGEEIDKEIFGSYDIPFDNISEDFDISMYAVNETKQTVFKWYDYKNKNDGWELNQTIHKESEEYSADGYFYVKGISGKAIGIVSGELVKSVCGKETGIIIAKAPLWTFMEYKENYL